MKIGIDLDGVVIDSERQFRNAAELYNMNVLKKNYIKDQTALRIKERYDWTDDEIYKFMKEELIKWAKKSSIMPGAKEVINLLKEEGHRFVVITSRGGTIPEMIDNAKEVLKRENLEFEKYYWKVEEKTEICLKENIDIMIEDSIKNCENMSKANIKTIYLRDSNMKPSNDPNIKEVYTWGEIYRYIKSL